MTSLIADYVTLDFAGGEDNTITVSNTGLQMEYTADTTAEDLEWTSVYTQNTDGTSTTDATTVEPEWDKGTDEHGDYYLMGGNERMFPSYPNMDDLLDMDESDDVTGGITYEAWVKLPTDGTTGQAWLMGPNSSWGPALALNDERLGSMRVSSNNGDRYVGISSPGYITDDEYEGELLHIVGYMYNGTGSGFENGVWINGSHYPGNATGGVGSPGLDYFSGGFVVGTTAYTPDTNSGSASGIQLYGFRVWHRQLTEIDVNVLYALGANGTVTSKTIPDYYDKDTTPNSGLQMEYIANTTATNTEWTSVYTENGTPATDITTVHSDWDKGTDEHGDYYLMLNNERIFPSYPNIEYLLSVDGEDANGTPVTNTDGFTYEAWVKRPTDTVLTGNAWLMGVNSGYGPALALNDDRFDGIRISASGGGYDGVTNPGLIEESKYDGELLHVVGYMYKGTGDFFVSGVWINGEEYVAAERVSTTPGLNTLANVNFCVGSSRFNQGVANNTASGIQLYGFRVWHRQLSATEVAEIYALGPQGRITPLANVDEGIIYRIPHLAYNNNYRGLNCLVSAVDCSLINNGGKEEITIYLDGIGIVNSYKNKDNDYVSGTPVFTTARCFGATADMAHIKSYNKPRLIGKYKCNPRPSSIIIKITSNRAVVSLTHGYITLKFEYYTDEEYKISQYGNNYTPAFPIPLAF